MLGRVVLTYTPLRCCHSAQTSVSDCKPTKNLGVEKTKTPVSI
jgi:hypothetical protein